MAEPKVTILDWLGYREKLNLGKARWLGPIVNVFVSLLAVIIFWLVTQNFLVALRGAGFESLADQSEAVRNTGLVWVAVVGAPFVVWRTWVAQRQSDTAADSLFNDKVNMASADLHAMRQRTLQDGKSGAFGKSIWEADVTRRNTGIDWLEGLVEERPKAATRVARLLSVYVRELSQEYPAKKPPYGAKLEKLREWVRGLEPARSDFQNAVSTLGRLRSIGSQVTLEKDAIDLRRANLQALELSQKNFNEAQFSRSQLQKANLMFAKMIGASFVQAELQGATLFRTEMQSANLKLAELQGASLTWTGLQNANLTNAGLEGTNLRNAHLQGAILIRIRLDDRTDLLGANLRGAGLMSVDLSVAKKITQEQVNSCFGDISVTLPKSIDRPSHWANEELGDERFFAAWRAWQKSFGFDPEDPSTWDDPKDT